MDIRKLAVAQTSKLHLRDANDELLFSEGNPVTVTLYSPGTKQYARARTDQSNRMMDKLKRKGKANQTAEQRAEESAQFLADCTESFENIKYDGLEGKALFKAVYMDNSIGFVVDQVDKHISDWSNFTKESQAI